MLPMGILELRRLAKKFLVCLRVLKHGYGFEREFRENVNNNARVLEKDPEEFLR